MHYSIRLFIHSLLIVAAAGCGTAGEDASEEMIDNSEQALKTDYENAGLAENTPEAVGVVTVANTLSYSEFRAIGLTKSGATNLVAHRVGADQVAGTSDDDPFDTLAEVDVPGVGVKSFQYLLAYAEANGFIPADFPTCSGTPHWPTAGNYYPSGGTIHQFERDCDAWGKCTTWEETKEIAALDHGNSEMWPVSDGVVPLWVDLKSNITDISQNGGHIICYDVEYAYLNFDPTTGTSATSTLQNWYECASGGSTSYNGNSGKRTVTAQAGDSCVAVTDVEPAAAAGHQSMRVIVLDL